MAFWFTCEGCAKDFLRNGLDPILRPLYCTDECKSEHFARTLSRHGPTPKTYDPEKPLSVAPLKCMPDASERPAIRYPGVRV